MTGQFHPKSGIHPFGLTPRAKQQLQCRQNEILQRQKSSGAVSTQIGYAPVRLEAQGRTAVQRRQSDSSQEKNSSRAVSNQIGHAPVRLEAATTESREVSVSDTSHLTQPTETWNSLALANPAADRVVPCRKSEISPQQNDDGAVSAQIGHAPIRLEAQGQTAVAVHAKRDIVEAEWRHANFDSNRVCTRSVGSPAPDSRSAQAERFFAAAEQ